MTFVTGECDAGCGKPHFWRCVGGSKTVESGSARRLCRPIRDGPISFPFWVSFRKWRNLAHLMNSRMGPGVVCTRLARGTTIFAMPVETEITLSTYGPVKVPRGTRISCKGWQQEAAMRTPMKTDLPNS